MKQLKRTLAVLLLALCALVPALPAFAAQALVQDGAGLLSAEEARQLSAQAQAIQDDYGLPVYIITVPAMNGESDAYAYATQLYDQGGFGAGADQSGIMLLLSMQYRDYALIAHGEGNNVLTDYGNEKMADSFLSYFGEDDWAGGFADYLATAESYCHAYYVDGEAYDVGSANRGFLFVCIAIASPLVGGLAVAAMVQQMKTARRQTHAEYYVERAEGQNGLTLTDRSDDFIFAQTIVTHRPKPQDNGGGFGGTTIDAGGFSGSSGKF